MEPLCTPLPRVRGQNPSARSGMAASPEGTPQTVQLVLRGPVLTVDTWQHCFRDHGGNFRGHLALLALLALLRGIDEARQLLFQTSQGVGIWHDLPSGIIIVRPEVLRHGELCSLRSKP